MVEEDTCKLHNMKCKQTEPYPHEPTAHAAIQGQASNHDRHPDACDTGEKAEAADSHENACALRSYVDPSAEWLVTTPHRTGWRAPCR